VSEYIIRSALKHSMHLQSYSNTSSQNIS